MARGVKGSATPKPSPNVEIKSQAYRQLELRIECLKLEVEEAQNMANEQRTERVRAETREKELQKQLANERADSNVLRTMVHELEIDYAKLCGYIDGRHDSEPPRMVPERREPRFASYPDGTRRFNPRPNAYAGEPERSWYERR